MFLGSPALLGYMIDPVTMEFQIYSFGSPETPSYTPDVILVVGKLSPQLSPWLLLQRIRSVYIGS